MVNQTLKHTLFLCIMIKMTFLFQKKRFFFIFRKISKIFEKFLSPDGFDFLHSLYGRPSFFEILWRNVTIGISFGFSAIESSGSKFSSMLSSCMTTYLAYFHKMATNTWSLQPVNDSIQTSNLIHWMKLSLKSLLVEQTKNIELFPSFVPLDRTFYTDHSMCSHLQSHLYSAFRPRHTWPMWYGS